MILFDPEQRFTGLPVLTEHIDGRTWRLVREVTYRTEAGAVCTVRIEFVFDFASVPRIFWRLIPPTGLKGQPYGIAALIHDWLYRHKAIGGLPITRAMADAIFLEIMLYLGVHRWLARTMYRAVRLGGWLPWRRGPESPEKASEPRPIPLPRSRGDRPMPHQCRAKFGVFCAAPRKTLHPVALEA